VGHGSVGGNEWSLAGRGIKGTLPQPLNTFRQEGKVVVQIRVNAAGQVVSATIKGGDVSDKQTQQLALDAARKAKFTEGEHDQIGTITYIFKLN
jgi:TonB family protein